MNETDRAARLQSIVTLYGTFLVDWLLIASKELGCGVPILEALIGADERRSLA